MTHERPGIWTDAAFAEGLRLARRKYDLSQEEVAAGMNALGFEFQQSTVGKIERGERRVSVGEAASLAEVLQISLLTILDVTPSALDARKHRLEVQSAALKRDLDAWFRSAAELADRYGQVSALAEEVRDESADDQSTGSPGIAVLLWETSALEVAALGASAWLRGHDSGRGGEFASFAG